MTMEQETRRFYRTLVQLAIPVTIQNMITSSLNMVDTIMIGQLGAVEVAAVGLANRLFFIMILMLFAISSGTAIFTAQYWGKKDVQHIGKVMAIALFANVTLAMFFSGLAIFIPNVIMRVFTTDQHVIAAGSGYLQVVGGSYVFTAVTILYVFVIRSMEQVKLPMYASVIALSLNTFLNYCLIFGHFGFPALGVKGAALATLIARIIELTIIVAAAYWKRYPTLRYTDIWEISPGLLKQFSTTVLPVTINEFSWVMGVTVYAIVYGRIGTTEIAAINIVNSVEHLFVSIFFGLASAASTMIGNQIGANKKDLAFMYAKRFALIAPLGAVGMGGILALAAPLIVLPFKVPQDVRQLALNTLFILSSVLWIKMFNMINIVGILRGGGDTKFSMYLEMLAIWLIGVPLALVGAFVWEIAVYWLFGLVQLEELSKMIIGIFRMYSKKWIHNLANSETTKPPPG